VGYSSTHTQRCFHSRITKALLSQLVFWLKIEVIRDHLPLAFRANLNDVSCIIDAFEIKIERNGKKELQYQTYSSYKNQIR